MIFSAIPGKQGLYDPETEQDSCGVAMVADIRGRRSHGIVTDGLAALTNLDHRGAAGAEPTSGDGAGILLQLPDALLRAESGFALPDPTSTGATPTPPASRSCPPTPSSAARPSSWPNASPSRRAWRSSAGARSRSTPTAPTSARPPAR